MADAFIGEIRAFPYTYVPQGWLRCDGTLYPINQFQALYALLGIVYGGDGKTIFGLPNLQGRTVIGVGQGAGLQNVTKGQQLGAAQVALTSDYQLPVHNHALVEENIAATISAANTTAKPTAGQSWLTRPAQVTPTTANFIFSYVPTTGGALNTPLHPSSIGYNVGGSQGHENRQPYLTMVYCINYDGVYPVSS